MGIADEGVRLTLRLPEALRDRLLQRARRNRRSMNSEIVAILGDAESVTMDSAVATVGLSRVEEPTPCNVSNEMLAEYQRLPARQARLLLALVKTMNERS